MTPELWDAITGTTQADYDNFVFLLILIGITVVMSKVKPRYIIMPPEHYKHK